MPRRFRRPLYGTFARWAGVDLAEVAEPFEAYPTFGSFFARPIHAALRPLAREVDALLSPCDSVVAASGYAERGKLLQVKGIEYDLAELLGDAALAARLEGGAYLTCYLSPRDYHRVHAPVAARLCGWRYIPGTLFPVKPFFAERVDGLLARNERMVLELDGPAGPMALVMVAAIGVGNIALSIPAIETREFRAAGIERSARLEPSPAIGRGDELGAFLLGSTVVLVCSPGRVALADGAEVGRRLRFGERVGTCAPAPRST